MKELGLIALIMVLGLSGCASSGTSDSIKQGWTWYGEGDSWETIKQRWAWYGYGETDGWESIKQGWRKLWN